MFKKIALLLSVTTLLTACGGGGGGAHSLGMTWNVNDKRKPKKNLSSSQKKRNRKLLQVRARVEHCFRVIKC